MGPGGGEIDSRQSIVLSAGDTQSLAVHMVISRFPPEFRLYYIHNTVPIRVSRTGTVICKSDDELRVAFMHSVV